MVKNIKRRSDTLETPCISIQCYVEHQMLEQHYISVYYDLVQCKLANTLLCTFME